MKKIAVNTIKAFLKENKRSDGYKQTFHVGESSFEVVFHTVLSINEKSIFINRVLSVCFDATRKFRPEYVSPMLRATIIQMCTNIPAMTLKNETGADGVPALDLDSMNELYLAMDLDNVQDAGYQAMLDEITCLCNHAIDWKKNNEAAFLDLLRRLAEEAEDIDIDTLMRYAGIPSESTEGSNEDDILQRTLKTKEAQITKLK